MHYNRGQKYNTLKSQNGIPRRGLREINQGNIVRSGNMSRIAVILENTIKYPSTAMIAEAFIRMAEAQGHVIRVFDTGSLHFDGCRGCETCFRNGNPCSFNDDFNIVAPALEKCDIIVYILPVFFYSVPADIKALMDKFFSYYITGRSFSGKKSAIIATSDDTGSKWSDPVKFMYKKSLSTLRVKNGGEIYLSGIRNHAGSLSPDDLPALIRGMIRSSELAKTL